LIYRARGLGPDEIAAKLGLSRFTVTQMLLAANPVKP
jgi:DNA-binding CsgD family transcriptional regulator